MKYVARHSNVDAEDQDEFGWESHDLTELCQAIYLSAHDLLSDSMDVGSAQEFIATNDSIERIGKYEFDGTPPFDDGFLHVEYVSEQPLYAVEVLVHYNITVEVRADSGDEAMDRAGEQARRWHPAAVLVDPVSYDVVSEAVDE